METLDLKPTPANIKAAERLMTKIRSAIEAGIYRRGDYFEGSKDKTFDAFSDYADSWIQTLTVAKSTKRSYVTAMRATWKPAFAGKTMPEIRYSDIKKAIAAKLAGGAKGKTVNNQLDPLRDLFKTAKADGVIESNPCDEIKNVEQQRPMPDPFTPDERDAILADMKDHYDERIYNYFMFAFHTGIRPSEQIILSWPDVDWNNRTVRVHRAMVDYEEKETKTYLERDINLSDAAFGALQRQKAFTFMKRPDGPIFEDPRHGEPFPTERAQRTRWFIPCLRRLGIRHRATYQTRHTFATVLLMGGVNPVYIAKQMGHTTGAMIFKHYAKWIDSADKGRAAAQANAVMMGRKQGPDLDELSPNCPRSGDGS